MKIVKKVTTSIIVSACLLSSGIANASSLDQYGQDTQYKSSYASSGCSELAWNQMVANYNSKINTYNAQVATLNKNILNQTVDPTKLKTSGCFGDAEAMFGKVISNAKDITSAMQDIKSGNFAQIFKGLVGNLVNKVTDQACKSASNAINNKLNEIGAGQYLSEMSSFANNPIGYGIDRSGVANSVSDKISGSMNNEWGSLVSNEVKQSINSIGKQ